MNIFRSIQQKENHHDYLFSKIKNLNRLGYIFPYSAAHLEEVTKLENSEFYLYFIQNISRNNSLRVGDIPTSYAKEMCNDFLELSQNPYICDADKKIYLKCFHTYNEIANHQNDNNPNLDFRTKLEKENIFTYSKRVTDDLNSTDTAENGNINFLGRRNEESRAKNNLPDYLPTSQETREKYNIDNAKISRLNHKEIFENTPMNDFLSDFFEERKIDFNNLFKNKFNSQHHYLEKMLSHIFNAFEIIGYVQEKNNSSKTLRNYTHDISHSIYGCRTDFFITNDDRFLRKLKAAYFLLKVPCRIMTLNEFLEFEFDSKGIIEI